MAQTNYILRFKKRVKRYHYELVREYGEKTFDDIENYYLKNHRVIGEYPDEIYFVQWLSVPFVQDTLAALGVIDHVHYVGF